MKHRILDIELKNGFLMAVLLGIYFIVLVIIGWSDNIFFKAGNALIAAFAIHQSIKASKILSNGSTNKSYLTHLGAGILTGIFGTLFSLAGLGVFLYAFPDSYENMLQSSIIPANTTVQLFIGLLTEGVSGTIVVSLVLMQYWKNFVFKKHLGFVERPQ